MTNNTSVKVWAGDGQTYLGQGELVGNVTVYYWWTGNNIRSLPDAEQRPDDGIIAQMAQMGMELIESSGNPKIVMDDGSIKYGCQVWWERIND